jgi:hypothetical protein
MKEFLEFEHNKKIGEFPHGGAINSPSKKRGSL